MCTKIEGVVSSLGEGGNLVTDIAVEKVADLPANDTVTITFGGHETIGIHPAEHGQPIGTLVASTGASGFLEIEIVGISVSEMLGIKVGEAVTVTA